MDLLFFDTSALVKRYHDEKGTDQVDNLIEGDGTVVLSSLSVIETVSAFRRKYNMGEVTGEQMNQLLSKFFQEALEDFIIVPMEESVMQFSFDLVLEEDLRTLDSLQLSAALSLNPGEDDNVVFISADKELVSVAEKRNLDTVNPGE